MNKIKVLLGATALTFSAITNAALIEYNDRSAWEANGSFLLENFDGLSSLTIAEGVDTAVGFNDMMRVFYQTSGGVTETENTRNSSNELGTGTELKLQWDTTSSDSTTSLVIRFDSAITGFGSTWGDDVSFIGGFHAGNMLTMLSSAGELFTFGQQSTSFFYGFRNALPFTTLSLVGVGSVSNGFLTPVLDDVVISTTSVPEPSTLAIFALGMIGLASRRFKKQS
jgi:hypothetical protein